MQRSKSTMAKVLSFAKDSLKETERKVMISRSKHRGISVASRDQKEKESIRSNSKIKLTHPSTAKLSARGPSTNKHP